MSLRLEIFVLLLTWLLFIMVDQVFIYFNFFWYFWWADILMHVWGGVLIVTSWFTVERMQVFPRTMLLRYNHPLLILLLMMVGWEVFEYIFNIANSTDYVFDTMLDFITGGMGGLVVFLLRHSRTIKK